MVGRWFENTFMGVRKGCVALRFLGYIFVKVRNGFCGTEVFGVNSYEDSRMNCFGFCGM